MNHISKAGESSNQNSIEMTQNSKIIFFLTKQMPKILTAEKAAKLEMQINSDDFKKTKKAREDMRKLIIKLIMDKADILILMSIKLHADIYKPKSYPESNPMIDFDGTSVGHDFNRSSTPEAYRQEVFNLSAKNIEYFMSIYNDAISPSHIKAPQAQSSYETAYRKLRFMSESISSFYGNNKFIEACNQVSISLHRAQNAYEHVMLSILDLHYKATADDDEKECIKNVIRKWKNTLEWDAEHLKKHAKKPQRFFDIAEDVLRDKLKFRSLDQGNVTSVRDIATALDYYQHYHYQPAERTEIIKQIEKEWRAWQRKFQPSTTPAKISQPKKTTSFKVDQTTHTMLSREKTKQTQSASIQTVMEYLSTNVNAALIDFKADNNFPLQQETTEKKQIVVSLNKATTNKIKLLKARFKLYASDLLEFATKYHAQSHNAIAADTTLNTRNQQHSSHPTQCSIPLSLIRNEQRPETEHQVTSEAAVYTQSRAEQLQSTKNESDLQLVSETTVAVAAEVIEPSNPVQESAPTEATAINAEQQAVDTLITDEKLTRMPEQQVKPLQTQSPEERQDTEIQKVTEQVAAPIPQLATSSNEVADDEPFKEFSPTLRAMMKANLEAGVPPKGFRN